MFLLLRLMALLTGLVDFSATFQGVGGGGEKERKKEEPCVMSSLWHSRQNSVWGAWWLDFGMGFLFVCVCVCIY